MAVPGCAEVWVVDCWLPSLGGGGIGRRSGFLTILSVPQEGEVEGKQYLPTG